MPRITPSSGSTIDITALEDDEPYKGILRKPKDGWFTKGSAEYGGEDRLTIDWEMEDGETVRDWISLRLGKQQNGTVSKLRMLLNALSEKPRDSEIKMFVTETLEWGYTEPRFDDDGKYLNPDNYIKEGMEVVFRGVRGTKQDGTGKYTVQKYQAPKAKAAGTKKNKADEIPF